MKRSHLLLAIIGIAALALFPVGVQNPYYIHLIETIMIYAIVLFGLDIVDLPNRPAGLTASTISSSTRPGTSL